MDLVPLIRTPLSQYFDQFQPKPRTGHVTSWIVGPPRNLIEEQVAEFSGENKADLPENDVF